MVNESARILVVGAGVNGSVSAVGLFRAGFDVAVLARTERFQQIAENGIEIEDPLTGTRTVTKVPVVDRLDPDYIYEYILVVVRKNQVRDLLPTLAENRSPCVVFMVNTALGPEEWVSALGAERILLGFAFAGGRREGSLVRAMRPKRGRTPFGEVNGAITPRLIRLVGILNRAGLGAKTETRMPDWLVTHAAMVAPLAIALLRHGCDTYALSRSKSDLRLLADAMRETIAVVRATGHRIVPRINALPGLLPRFVLVAMLRKLLASRLGEIGAGWHCSQAADEMQQLAGELKELMERSGLPAPALRELLKG